VKISKYTGNTLVDNLTQEQRSFTMSRIRSKDTAPELMIRRRSHVRGLRFRIHMDGVAGHPDMAFPGIKVAVFVDGDFWHGWRFPQWKDKLSQYWRMKIERNRCRDQSNFAKLRRTDWLVIRIWEHNIKRDVESCVDRIEKAVRSRSTYH